MMTKIEYPQNIVIYFFFVFFLMHFLKTHADKTNIIQQDEMEESIKLFLN